jgi:hypothetical protein
METIPFCNLWTRNAYLRVIRPRQPAIIAAEQKEIEMNTFIRSALVALVLVGAPAAMAQSPYNPGWVDKSKPHGGFRPNSQAGNRAFCDYQQERSN